MNNIHKVIFNKTTQQYVVVSELAKSVGKPKSVSADTVDIVSVLRNFSEKRPLDLLPKSWTYPSLKGADFMSKYPQHFKLKAVKAYFNQGQNIPPPIAPASTLVLD